jgi:hypothetical protein
MDLSFFEREGYQIIRGVVPPSAVQVVREFLNDSAESSVKHLMHALETDSLEGLMQRIDEAYKSESFDGLNYELRQIMSGHFPLDVRLSRTLWEVPRQPIIREIVQAALRQSTLFMHLPPVARFVLPRHTHAAVPAHQDVSYNKHLGDFLTLWIPFTTIDEECGGVAVFEGSNRTSEVLEDFSKRFWLKGVSTDGYKRIHCTMQPGDVLVLSRWIVHQSAPNTSKRTRTSIDFRFFGSGGRSLKHHLDLQTWQVIEPPN